MSTPAVSAHAPARRATRHGMLLGLAGVLMFSLSLPMTRLAGGTADDPQLPPLFVAVGRAAVAGLLSVGWLLVRRARRPRRSQLGLLAAGALGVVFGFPLFTGLAVRSVDAVHAAVVVGVLPLATAAAGALWQRQRASAGFWACAIAGCGWVLAYALLEGSGRLQPADGWLLAAVASAAVGYVAGARLASDGMAGEAVICWMLLLALPVTLPLAAMLAWRHAPQLLAARPAAWGGFAYVSAVSMWLGFFAWYRGLALGGTLRVSQVQLVQPFASMAAAGPLLGERLDALTAGFALAVIATVLVGRRMRVAPTPAAAVVGGAGASHG